MKNNHYFNYISSLAPLFKENDAMKLSNGNIVLTLIALLVSSVSANPSIVIRTLIGGNLTEAVTEEIVLGLESIAPKVNNMVNDVGGSRKLRVRDDRRLQSCTNLCEFYPPRFTICHINGLPRCRRALTMHEDLLEEEIADLNEDDRRRHLAIAALCQEAKSEVASAIGEAEREGIVPIPPDSTVVEQCFYAYP
jgi:hypothetical protein